MFQTESEFTLPLGFLDSDGTLHREGVMRLATAADEILPLKDLRVQQNPAYLIVILLSRVVTRLGGIEQVTTRVISISEITRMAAVVASTITRPVFSTDVRIAFQS